MYGVRLGCDGIRGFWIGELNKLGENVNIRTILISWNFMSHVP